MKQIMKQETDWKFNMDRLTLTHRLNEGYAEYEIDLEDCTDSAQILDWIVQISRKKWANDVLVGALVRWLDKLLDLQGNVCSFGKDHKIDPEKIISARRVLQHRFPAIYK